MLYEIRLKAVLVLNTFPVAMRFDFSNTTPAFAGFLEYAASSLSAEPIDWNDDPYHYSNVVITALFPSLNLLKIAYHQ